MTDWEEAKLAAKALRKVHQAAQPRPSLAALRVLALALWRTAGDRPVIDVTLHEAKLALIPERVETLFAPPLPDDIKDDDPQAAPEALSFAAAHALEGLLERDERVRREAYAAGADDAAAEEQVIAQSRQINVAERLAGASRVVRVDHDRLGFPIPTLLFPRPGKLPDGVPSTWRSTESLERLGWTFLSGAGPESLNPVTEFAVDLSDASRSTLYRVPVNRMTPGEVLAEGSYTEACDPAWRADAYKHGAVIVLAAEQIPGRDDRLDSLSLRTSALAAIVAVRPQRGSQDTPGAAPEPAARRLMAERPGPVLIEILADPGTILHVTASPHAGIADVAIHNAEHVDSLPVEEGGLAIQVTGPNVTIDLQTPSGSTLRTNLPREEVLILRGELEIDELDLDEE